MRVLLTGGAGYIGSHTALVLVEHGHDVVVLDNFANGSREAVRRVEELTGATIPVIEADLASSDAVRALSNHEFDAVIHLAGLKAVAESVVDPVRYYRTNLISSMNLLDIMRERAVTRLVFSSSATVYGDPQYLPQDEAHPIGAGSLNPYGASKAMNECIIRDAQKARAELSAVILRYFNPVGAHSSGRIGEDPRGTPNNLMPYITQVAIGKRDRLRVFGNHYPTRDGTAIRDYIHVMDLAEGHVAALERASEGVVTYNLGSGVGASVLEVIATFEAATGIKVPHEIVPPRAGDVPLLLADASKAIAELDWKTMRTLADACRDSWTWQHANPNGYSE